MIVKMYLTLAIFSAFIAIGLSQPKPGRGGAGGRGDPNDKFCNKSLSDAKITEMGNCEQYIPQEVKTNVDTCLKKMNKGTTFPEFRNTVCDASLGEQFMKCQRDNMKTQKKSGNKPPTADHEAFKKHGECMGKVLNS